MEKKASLSKVAVPPIFLEFLEPRIAPSAYVVTSIADSGEGTLRDAIQKANASAGPDTITFAKKGTIKLSSDLPAITDDLDISAINTKVVKGVAKETLVGITIDGAAAHQVFDVNGTGVDASFEGLKITNAFSQTGGSAFAIDTTGDVLIYKSTIVKVTSKSTTGDPINGGAILIANGNVILDADTITSSLASTGGTALGGAIFNGGNLTITNGSSLTMNVATGEQAAGGAIYNDAEATLHVIDSTIDKNKALGTPGLNGVNGIKGANGAKGDPGQDGEPGEDGTDGDAGTDGGSAVGGGIYNLGTLTLHQSSVSGNLAQGGNGGSGGSGGAGGTGGAGGKAYSSYGYRTPAGHKGYNGYGGAGGSGGYAGNAAGGGIYNGEEASLTIEGSTLATNAAKAGLKGVDGKSLGSPTPVTVDSSMASGGAIFNAGTLVITALDPSSDTSLETTISKNIVSGFSGDGGGISSAGSASLTHTLVSGNTVTARAGKSGVAGYAGYAGYKGDPGMDGGPGGNGGEGGAGTDGGAAVGGGIASTGVLAIHRSTISGNTITSGAGGNGGAGGKGGKGGAGGRAYSYDGYHTPAGHAGYGGAGGNGGDAGGAGAANGAGVFSHGTSLTIDNASLIATNTSKMGLAGKVGLGGAAGSASAEKGANGMVGNAGTGDGGGIFADLGTFVISNTIIQSNISAASGAGAALVGESTGTLSAMFFLSNKAKLSGGGLLWLGDNVINNGVSFSLNTAAQNPNASPPFPA